MNMQQHAWAARQLIDACGGVEACESIVSIKRAQLYNYRNPNSPYTMPADVLATLEAYCGRAVYSSALVENAGPGVASSDLEGEALELNEHSAQLARSVHEALADGRLDAAEREALQRHTGPMRGHLDSIDRAAAGPDARRATLREAS